MAVEGMKVRSEERSGAVVLAPQGDVDLACSPVLRDALKKALAVRPGLLVVDLSAVEYMDSSGVATLVEALQTARKSATKIVLCSLNARVYSIFEIARLHTVFKIAPTLDAALAG
jgi:anti-sigma B factor antagonist